MSFFIANQFRELFGKAKEEFNSNSWFLPYSKKIEKQLKKEDKNKKTSSVNLPFVQLNLFEQTKKYANY